MEIPGHSNAYIVNHKGLDCAVVDEGDRQRIVGIIGKGGKFTPFETRQYIGDPNPERERVEIVARRVAGALTEGFREVRRMLR